MTAGYGSVREVLGFVNRIGALGRARFASCGKSESTSDENGSCVAYFGVISVIETQASDITALFAADWRQKLSQNNQPAIAKSLPNGLIITFFTV